MALERIQKIISKAGISSRRKAEVLILDGAVTVNGKLITELGSKADLEKDKIKVNGKLIFAETQPIYLAFYKPMGVLASMGDPEGRKDLTYYTNKIKERVFPVGRLDYNSEGLIILTNDGRIAEKIAKNKTLTRTYHLKIKEFPEFEDLKKLERTGIFTSEGVLRFKRIKVLEKLRSKTWLEVEISEGYQLDIREMFNRKGMMVDKIIRYSIGNINVRGLVAGTYKPIDKADITAIANLK